MIAIALLAWLGGGCARAVVVQTDRATLAAIEVYNESGTTMIVSYEGAAGGRATLGAVPPGGTERFIITLPAGTAIRVTGTSQGGERVSGPHAVTLQEGTTQRITLR